MKRSTVDRSIKCSSEEGLKLIDVLSQNPLPSMNRNMQSLCHYSLPHGSEDEQIYILVRFAYICHVDIRDKLLRLTNVNLSHWRSN